MKKIENNFIDNLYSEDKNDTWKFVIKDKRLFYRNGNVKTNVLKLCKYLENINHNSYDVAIYGVTVAFKVPSEKKTYIYITLIHGVHWFKIA